MKLGVKRTLIASFAIGSLVVVGLAGWLYATVPSIQRVTDYDPQVPLRIYSRDGRLIGQFGAEYRLPRPMGAVPKQLEQAFLAAEDAAFFDHPGVDITGILRALWVDLRAWSFEQGASTITQQVARSFLLTDSPTLSRKLQETVLAFEIETVLSKKAILHRYLNQIYLGSGAYGVAAAARTYYDKPLAELTLAEMAVLAGLPKGPAYFNPVRHPDRARQRRDYVLQQMLDQGWVDPEAVLAAMEQPIHAARHDPVAQPLPLVADSVRRRVVGRLGQERAFTGGYRVVTTVDYRQQRKAQQAVQDGLIAFTRRHGFRGPVDHWSLGAESDASPRRWQKRLAKEVPGPGPLRPALVLGVKGREEGARALLADGRRVRVPWSGLRWARPYQGQRAQGDPPESPGDVLERGDVVFLASTGGRWQLAQRPRAQGALVAMEAETGAVRAMVGAFDPERSAFNRAVQARRQPGSAFKPIIYAAGLAQGLTPATRINDAPAVYRAQEWGTSWRPENYSRTFHGPTRLRQGLVHSRNLMAVRLLDRIGLGYGRQMARRFGFEAKRLPDDLSLALGAGSVTPLRLTGGYAVLANHGEAVEPYWIRRILRCDGTVIEDRTALASFRGPTAEEGEQVLSPQVSFQATDILRGVVTNGTGWRVDQRLERPVAGKTGTTNRQRDAWFVGYDPELVTGVWVGFDKPRSLGTHETGSRAASPIWADFMANIRQAGVGTRFQRPEGLVRVRIDPGTGLLAAAESDDGVWEWFRKGNAPTRTAATDPDQPQPSARPEGSVFF